MNTFTKLESGIIGSTIWAEDDHTRLLWITMLALADRDGYVGASIPGLAGYARIPVESVERAIEKFLSPDKYSRSQEHEGRRITETERGWLLLNYTRIRGERDAEERRAQDAERKRAARAASKADASAPVRDVRRCPPQSAHIDIDLDLDLEEEKEKTKTKPSGQLPLADVPFRAASGFAEAWAAYPRKEGRKEAERHYRASVKTEADHQTLLQALERYKAELVRRKRTGEWNGAITKIQKGSTWFNGWQDWADDPDNRDALTGPRMESAADPWEAMSQSERESHAWEQLKEKPIHGWLTRVADSLDAGEEAALQEFYGRVNDVLAGPPKRAWATYKRIQQGAAGVER